MTRDQGNLQKEGSTWTLLFRERLSINQAVFVQAMPSWRLP